MQKIIFEFTRSRLKFVSAKIRPVPPTVTAIKTEPLNSANEAELIRRLIFGIKARDLDCAVIIPREQVITRLLKLPTVNPSEIASMVSLIGPTQLPYPQDDIVLDFNILEQGEGSTTVNMVACHDEMIKGHLGHLAGAGIFPSHIIPSSWALASWYVRFCRSLKASEPAMLVSCDCDHVDLALLNKEKVIFSRAIGQGYKELKGSNDEAFKLVQEIELSMASLRKDFPGVEIASFIVTGPDDLEELKEVISQRLGKPALFVKASSCLRVPSSKEVSDISMAAIAGCMSDSKELAVNLLPVAFRKQRQGSRTIKELKKTFALLAITFLIGIAALGLAIRRQKNILEETKKAVISLGVAADNDALLEGHINLIESSVSSRQRLARILSGIFQKSSNKIAFENITFESYKNEISIRASASSTRDVLDYLAGLETAKLCKKAELKYSSQRSTAYGMRTEFEAALQLQYK